MIETTIRSHAAQAINVLYSANVAPEHVIIQKTRKDFDGDFTLVVFPLLRISKKPPEQTATELGEYLKNNITWFSSHTNS